MKEDELIIKNKVLLLLDFDNTIVKGFSDEKVLALINNEELIREILGEGKASWAEVMQRGFVQMKKENRTISQIKEIIENLEFNDNFYELLEYIKKNSELYEAVIMSGANTLFLKWFIEKNRLDSVFKNYFALNAEVDDEKLIKIDNCHQHSCPDCNISQCKQKLVSDFLIGKEYRNVIFVGDGHNDFCAGKYLGEENYLFPRIDFPLHKLVNDSNMKKKIKCKVLSWINGLNIISFLKNII